MPKRLQVSGAVIAAFLAGLLSACDDPTFVEEWKSGSQLAVEACIKRNASTLIEPSTIKHFCIKKHERKIATTALKATLSADPSNPYGLALELNLTNNSTNLIVTRTRVVMSFKREGQPDFILRGVSDETWVVPQGYTTTYIRYDSPDAEKEWAEAKKLLLAKANWNWWFSDADGIRFELK